VELLTNRISSREEKERLERIQELKGLEEQTKREFGGVERRRIKESVRLGLAK
jgi:hypothetical protein